MELTAMSDSLFNANVYSVYLTTEEGPGSYHRELGELRRKFFENGKKKQKYNSKSSMLGYPEKIKGRIKKHDLKWKKTAGTVVKEEAFCISKNFVVVIRDLGGSIISKITYNRDMLWIKTEYFRTDNYTTPHTILKPRDTENSIELFTYNFEKARYSSVILYPAPYKADTPEQSIINAKHGDEFVILSSDRGSFCYCPEAEQQARLQTAKEMESGTIMLTTAWEVKDGEVPEPALEPNGDEGAILDIIDAIMNKEVPELEEMPESTEIPDAIDIPETEGVTEAVQVVAGEIIEADLQLETDNEPEAENTETELAITPVTENISLGVSTKHNYVGNIVRGKREGRGRTEQQNGLTVYDGEYKDNMKDGFGASYYADGDLSYVGGWKEDKKDGVGVSFRKEDHALHISGWKEGEADSFTTLIDEEGNLRFSGRIIEGKKQGAGVSYRREDDTIFVGRYTDGEADSYGSLFDKDGTLIYTGEWKDGKRNGQGTEFDQKGQIVYSGEWKDDKYHNGVLYRKVNPQ